MQDWGAKSQYASSMTTTEPASPLKRDSTSEGGAQLPGRRVRVAEDAHHPRGGGQRAGKLPRLVQGHALEAGAAQPGEHGEQGVGGPAEDDRVTGIDEGPEAALQDLVGPLPSTT